MRQVGVLIVNLLLIGCGGSPTSPDQKPVETVTAAPGGKSIEFPDTPGLTKTEVRDGTNNVQSIGYLLNGLKEGSWIEYHTNGVVRSVTTYVQGKKEGLYLELNENNQLMMRCFYHNDLRQGEYREYAYSNIREERNYEKGKQDGVTKIYYDNSKVVMEEAQYKDGKRNGISKWFDQLGGQTIEYEYKNGELVKK